MKSLKVILSDASQGDERFAVTGATGWLGRCTLDVLDDLLGPQDAAVRVAVAVPESPSTRPARSKPMRAPTRTRAKPTTP